MPPLGRGEEAEGVQSAGGPSLRTLGCSWSLLRIHLSPFQFLKSLEEEGLGHPRAGQNRCEVGMVVGEAS